MAAGWLDALEAQRGVAEHQRHGSMHRWVWRDGDYGVLVDRATHVWQVVAWTPVRSVTVRSAALPDDGDCSRAVVLAGLDTHGLVAP